MQRTSEAVLEAALKLPESERLTLVSRLLEAVPAEDSALALDDGSLLEELERRLWPTAKEASRGLICRRKAKGGHPTDYLPTLSPINGGAGTVHRCTRIPPRVFVLLVYLLSAASGVYGQESELDRALAEDCCNGNTDGVAALLKQGANPNAARGGEPPALIIAASRGHLKIMRLLIDHGAHLNAKDTLGRTPLLEAAACPDPEGVKMLLDAGAKPDPSALGHACWLGRMEAAKLLLDAGVSPDAGLPQAAQGRHHELVSLLLKRGADVNTRSKDGNTALHLGALQGGFKTVQLLLDNAADPNAVNNEGETPLHMAVSGDCELQRVKLLVESGAKLNLADDEGVTPVRLAAIRGAKDIYAWLVAMSGGKEPRIAWSHAHAPQEGARPTQELLAALAAEKKEDRLAAQRELVARGQQVMPDVLKSIESGTGIERFCELFAAMGPEAEAALPPLTSQLSKKEHVFVAAVTIDRIKPGAFVALPQETKQKTAAALYEAIVDPKADVMAGFCTELLVRMGKSATPTILRLLRHKNPKYRALAAQILTSARFSDEQIEAELVTLAQGDQDRFVRAAAADGLGGFGEPGQKVKAALLSMIKNPPPFNPLEADNRKIAEMGDWWDTADHAARSLARFGASVIDDLIPLLSPLDAPERLPAITALQSIGAPAVPRLIALLADEDRSVAISASVALNRMRGPAVPGLAKAVSTGSEQVIDHAANALWWIGPGARAAIPSLLEVAGSELRSDASRLAAARAALKIDASSSRKSEAILSAIPMLVRTLEKGRFEHQGWSAETLGRIGLRARDALPMLRRRLDLPDENTDTGHLVRDYVQREAKEAITAIETDIDSAKTP